VNLLLRASQLIDGTGAPPRRDQEVRVEDGVIRAIGPIGETAAPPGWEVHEYPEATVLPGLIDAHVHLTFSAEETHEAVRERLAAESEAELLDRALANARAHLLGGVTSLRDTGGRGYVTLAAREAARRDPHRYPRMAVCGPAITTRQGHLFYLEGIAEGEEAVRAAARSVLAHGADFVKLCATGGIMTRESDPMAAQYTVAELHAAVAETECAGTLVAAHVLNREGLERCVAAGVRSIEHCLWQVRAGEFDFNADTAAVMRQGGVVAGLTFAAISQAGYRAARGEGSGSDMGPWQAHLANRYEAERAMVASGVSFVVHSDAGVRQTPFGQFWVSVAAAALELRLSPLEAIRSVTASPAALLGWEREVGTLIPGKRADLLVVQGDPAVEVEALANVASVYRDGFRAGAG
jgi:imidazolonepropionase-like amidohydrolase